MSSSAESLMMLYAGTSSLSAPILFTTAGQEIGAAAAPVSGGAASAIGGAVACILLTAILLAGALYYRHRKVRPMCESPK